MTDNARRAERLELLVDVLSEGTPAGRLRGVEYGVRLGYFTPADGLALCDLPLDTAARAVRGGRA